MNSSGLARQRSRSLATARPFHLGRFPSKLAIEFPTDELGQTRDLIHVAGVGGLVHVVDVFLAGVPRTRMNLCELVGDAGAEVLDPLVHSGGAHDWSSGWGCALLWRCWARSC